MYKVLVSVIKNQYRSITNVYVYVYICVYVCIYIYIYVYVYVCYICVCVYIYVYVCIYIRDGSRFSNIQIFYLIIEYRLGCAIIF